MKVKLKKPVLRRAKEKQAQEIFSRSKARHLLTVWGFLVLALISGAVTLSAYVDNSRQAEKLYNQLLAVDAAGGNVEQSLYSLRSFMYAHMNTKIGSDIGVKPPIQLKATYDRLVAAEKARVANAKTSNATLYTRAEQECERLIPDGLSGRGRVPCITDFVTKNNLAESINPISKALYQFDFTSPIWSADTAGIGMAVTSVLLLVFLLRWFTYRRALHHLRLAS